MGDLIERLRRRVEAHTNSPLGVLLREAADELETMQADKFDLEAALEYLKAHRESATMNQNVIIKALSEVRDEQRAEIEALRAEVERPSALLRQAEHSLASIANEQYLRAERLAEALDTIARVGKASRNQTTRTRWIVARAISALNGDDDWQVLPKPKGFHVALLRDQEVGNE